MTSTTEKSEVGYNNVGMEITTRNLGINRIILIGNGFDLSHGLKTKYENFYEWYWEQRFMGLKNTYEKVSDDGLCSYNISYLDIGFKSYIYQRGLTTEKDWKHIKVQIENDKAIIFRKDTLFFSNICKKIETKGWVDIENEYYNLLKKYVIAEITTEERDRRIEELNNQLTILKEKLIEYLSSISISEGLMKVDLSHKIYAPINKDEVAVNKIDTYYDHIENWVNASDEEWDERYDMYKYSSFDKRNVVDLAHRNKQLERQKLDEALCTQMDLYGRIRLPNRIMFLNFNYTPLADKYSKGTEGMSCVHIHGEISNPEHVIFGYGDEIDKTYQKLVDFNNNDYLENIKSIQYNDEDNYHKVLDFVESAPFQIYIMGHSCGISDRTLLNTLFEHKNCVSIKPFYHQFEDNTDNYRDLVKNISRNFTDMKLMRSLVVNKKYCETI